MRSQTEGSLPKVVFGPRAHAVIDQMRANFRNSHRGRPHGYWGPIWEAIEAERAKNMGLTTIHLVPI